MREKENLYLLLQLEEQLRNQQKPACENPGSLPVLPRLCSNRYAYLPCRSYHTYRYAAFRKMKQNYQRVYPYNGVIP